jgi:antagonist of KipI
LPRVLRLLPGSELPEAALAVLTTQVLQVSPQSDRMGLRLQGQAIERPAQDLRLSAGLAFGSVQLPPDGQPIILAADRQSTGGYPLLGTVATVDHGQIAQLRPGERVVFTPITLDEAHHALRARQVLEARALWLLRQYLQAPDIVATNPLRLTS